MAVSVGWDGAGRGAASLTYYIGEIPASVGLTRDQVETAIETALDAWADVANLTFTPTASAGQARSIDFTFRSLDGAGGTLARAYFPADVNPRAIAGDVQFDAAERWEIGNARGAAATDLVLVAVHELGHALGLDHLDDVPSIMNDTVSNSQSFTGLQAADVDAILQLYAPAPTTSTSVNSNSNSNSLATNSAPAAPTIVTKPQTTLTTTSTSPAPTSTTNTTTTSLSPRVAWYWWNSWFSYYRGYFDRRR